MNTAAIIASELLDVEAVLLSPIQPFLWASGMKSPIYCDNRKVLSYPKSRTIVKNALVEKAKSEFPEFDMIAGVATAGIPHGALMADAMDKPFVYVRSKSKGHGLNNLIEGHLEGNERVLVVEDLISTGKSSVRAIESLKERGCEVVGCISIFNYGFEKAVQTFAKAECPFYSLSNYDALIVQALEKKYILESDMEALKRWRENPNDWMD